MKLTRIKYSSAAFFGAIALIFYAILGSLLWTVKDYFAEFGYSSQVSAFQLVVQTPFFAGLVTFVGALIMIAVYNFVAKKYPIAWEVKK